MNETSDHDDLITKALYALDTTTEDSFNAKNLREELMKVGLCICSDVPVGWKLISPTGIVILTAYKNVGIRYIHAYNYRMEPIYAAV